MSTLEHATDKLIQKPADRAKNRASYMNTKQKKNIVWITSSSRARFTALSDPTSIASYLSSTAS